MRLVRYGRYGGMYPPDCETLDIGDDGTFAMWRAVGGPIIGRFAGMVPDLAAITAAVEQVGSVRAPHMDGLESGEPEERVTLGDGDAESFASSAEHDGPWGELIGALRRLLDELRDQPRASIEATLPEPALLRLQHRGEDVIPIAMGALSVEVSRWHDSAQAGSALIRPPDLGSIDAQPGWSLEVELDVEAVSGPGHLVVEATFVAVDNGVFIPVVTTARSPAAAP